MRGAATSPSPAFDGWEYVRDAEVLTDGTHIVVIGEPDSEHGCEEMGCSTENALHVLLPEHELPSHVRAEDPPPLMSIQHMVRTLHSHLKQRGLEAQQRFEEKDGVDVDPVAWANIENSLEDLFSARSNLRDAIRLIFDEDDRERFVTEILGDEDEEGGGEDAA